MPECHVCKAEHPKPEKYCVRCLATTSGQYVKRKWKKYMVWCHDPEGDPICRNCYNRIRSREIRAGIPAKRQTLYHERRKNMQLRMAVEKALSHDAELVSAYCRA